VPRLRASGIAGVREAAEAPKKAALEPRAITHLRAEQGRCWVWKSTRAVCGRFVSEGRDPRNANLNGGSGRGLPPWEDPAPSGKSLARGAGSRDWERGRGEARLDVSGGPRQKESCCRPTATVRVICDTWNSSFSGLAPNLRSRRISLGDATQSGRRPDGRSQVIFKVHRLYSRLHRR